VHKIKILTIFGTRPEAIKLSSVVMAIEKDDSLESVVCITGQQRELLDQTIHAFGIKVKYDLNLMLNNQTLEDITANIIMKLKNILLEVKPDLVLVHGDTTTSMASALACFYNHIPVGHIEAGLRTNKILSPWPEELNRQIISRIATINFAPTEESKQNLINENVPIDSIHVTGNTVIDSLLITIDKIRNDESLRIALDLKLPQVSKTKKIIVVTSHRRENFGKGFENICKSLIEISKMDNVSIVYPVHLNPNIKNIAHKLLSKKSNIYLTKPLDYLSFVRLMDRSYLILTDSGGIQEEAPSLGKPVLVMRNSSERPEAIREGTVRLVGTEVNTIVNGVKCIINSHKEYEIMSKAHNIYGDGFAASRIINIIKEK